MCLASEFNIFMDEFMEINSSLWYILTQREPCHTANVCRYGCVVSPTWTDLSYYTDDLCNMRSMEVLKMSKNHYRINSQDIKTVVLYLESM